MKQIIEHLEAALALLKTRNAQAHERYEKYERRFTKSTVSSSRAMREAWYEYRATADMIQAVNNALANAQEVPS